jgi:hypothetical protein
MESQPARVLRILYDLGGEAAAQAIMGIKKMTKRKNSKDTGDEFRDNAGNRGRLFSDVRDLYCKDEERNRAPDYKGKLQEIADILDEGSADFEALSRLIMAPLKKQYHTEKTQRRIFQNAEAERRFRLLRCCRDEFYRFAEPQQLLEMHKPRKP